MRGYRKNRRPGNRPMTDAELELTERAKRGPCIPCLIQHEAHPELLSRNEVSRWNEWDHHKEGNLRVGHLWGWASCQWHHRRIAPAGKFEAYTRKYGPSLMDGSAAFYAYYGSPYELILRQYRALFPRHDIPETFDRAIVEAVLEGLTEEINRRTIIGTFDPEPGA